ncbi:MAG: hypothetical protein GKC10_09945 [Methanosarcinales archaeon]|nr:hypothetical protein [Methanosarcinales archaeon]
MNPRPVARCPSPWLTRAMSLALAVTLILVVPFLSGCLDQGPAGEPPGIPMRTAEARNYSQPLGPYQVSFSTPYQHRLMASGPITAREGPTGEVEVEGYLLELDGGRTRIEIYDCSGREADASPLEMRRLMEETARARQVTGLEISPRQIDGREGVQATGISQGEKVRLALYLQEAVDRHGYAPGCQKVVIQSTGTGEEMESLQSSIQVRLRH